VAIFADTLAINDPHATDARRSYIPPQGIHWFDYSGFNPHVFGLTGKRDMKTFKVAYVPDPGRKLKVTLFAHGYSYDLLGIIPTDIHLVGLQTAQPIDGVFLLGTDQLGRDLFSRMMVATRISLSIGLVSVGLSLILGVLLGGVSGLYGGVVDTVIQRAIEVIRSIPPIPSGWVSPRPCRIPGPWCRSTLPSP
jgi:peptide/nickel transport system permease protein